MLKEILKWVAGGAVILLLTPIAAVAAIIVIFSDTFGEAMIVAMTIAFCAAIIFALVYITMRNKAQRWYKAIIGLAVLWVLPAHLYMTFQLNGIKKEFYEGNITAIDDRDSILNQKGFICFPGWFYSYNGNGTDTFSVYLWVGVKNLNYPEIQNYEKVEVE